MKKSNNNTNEQKWVQDGTYLRTTYKDMSIYVSEFYGIWIPPTDTNGLRKDAGWIKQLDCDKTIDDIKTRAMIIAGNWDGFVVKLNMVRDLMDALTANGVGFTRKAGIPHCLYIDDLDGLGVSAETKVKRGGQVLGWGYNLYAVDTRWSLDCATLEDVMDYVSKSIHSQNNLAKFEVGQVVDLHIYGNEWQRVTVVAKDCEKATSGAIVTCMGEDGIRTTYSARSFRAKAVS